MGKKLVVGSVLVLVLAYYLGAFNGGPKVGKIVEIKTGKIQGIISKSRDGRDFYEWLGIPYAKPPVGQLRYATPVPPERWDGVKDTTKYGPKCTQLRAFDSRIVGEEDCLYLNVHVPKVVTKDELPRDLPVMVFIHGGAYIRGSADSYRPEYFMDHDVILVTLNYRLGSFGFLSTTDEVVRGNMGLKDQALALKLVQENIRVFGGDPQRVTLFGESAGGVSVHYHMLSPSSRGLFSKAIIQSGAAILPATGDSPKLVKQLTKRLAASVGCDKDDSVKLVECLRSRSVEDILYGFEDNHKFHEVLKPQMDVHPFRPTIEAVNDSEAFITEHPLTIIAKGQAQRIPCLMGVNADEGLLTSIEFYKNESAMADFESDWDAGVARTFGIAEAYEQLQEIAAKVRKFYFPRGLSAPSKEEKLKIYTKMFSDAVFNLWISETVQMQREFSPIHFYRFNVRGGPSVAAVMAELKGELPFLLEFAFMMAKRVIYNFFQWKPKDYGVCHGDELPLLFQMPEVGIIPKDEGSNSESSRLYRLSKDLVTLWTDFASGDGTNLQFRGVKLEPVKQKGQLKCFDISDEPKMIPEPFEDRVKFLKSLNYIHTIS